MIDGSEVEPVEAKCMWCGKECTTTETVYTGDEESYKGYEFWVYCQDCKVDTFYKLKPKKK